MEDNIPASEENEKAEEQEQMAQEEPKKENEEMKLLASKVAAIKAELAKMIIGQEELVELMLMALFTKGHVLIEGIPGVAKTMSARLLSKCIDSAFSRIQFTPDLMPADVLGSAVFDQEKSSFDFKQGPIFSNLILIDEVNRAPAKTQSALIEVMEERQVSVDGKSYQMDEPFFIVATQNPIEQEGTYQLPEAQLDRFVFRVRLNYPGLKDEVAILKRYASDFEQDESEINKVINSDELKEIHALVEKVYIKDEVIDYIAKIIDLSRRSQHLYLGASPRASLWLLKVSKAFAAMQGRDFVTPDDVKYLAPFVLNHRVILSHERELEGLETEEVIRELIEEIEVPR